MHRIFFPIILKFTSNLFLESPPIFQFFGPASAAGRCSRFVLVDFPTQRTFSPHFSCEKSTCASLRSAKTRPATVVLLQSGFGRPAADEGRKNWKIDKSHRFGRDRMARGSSGPKSPFAAARPSPFAAARPGDCGILKTPCTASRKTATFWSVKYSKERKTQDSDSQDTCAHLNLEGIKGSEASRLKGNSQMMNRAASNSKIEAFNQEIHTADYALELNRVNTSAHHYKIRKGGRTATPRLLSSSQQTLQAPP